MNAHDTIRRLQSRITRRSKTIATLEVDYDVHKTKAIAAKFYDPDAALAHRKAAKALRAIIKPLTRDQILDKSAMRLTQSFQKDMQLQLYRSNELEHALRNLTFAVLKQVALGNLEL
jgi:hypothetical protein